MNKTELIDAIAGESKLSKADAKKALEAFISVASQSLKKGDKLTLIGFGTFSVVDRPAHTARNPRTGEPLEVAAKKVVKFKPGTELSTEVDS